MTYYLLHPMEFMDQIESQFDEKKVIPWMQGHWHWSFYYSAFYLFFVWSGERHMRTRDPYNLRRALCMWSTLLCTFSIMSLSRISFKSMQIVYLGGWRHALCDTWGYVGSNRTGLWAFLFPLSKLPELFDTVFIVLRKQKLSVLHVYHHVSVFIYCWYSYAYPISTGVWFGIINFIVHGIMYMYYAVRASGRQLPRWVSKAITTIQLSQMFVGVFINYMGITSLLQGKTCATSWFDVGISVFFYISYAILFANFFYWAYIHPKSAKKPDKSVSAAKEKDSERKTEFKTKLMANGTSNGRVTANGVVHRR